MVAETNVLADILLATSNPHKLLEVKEILPDINWLSVADFPQLKDIDPEETGDTFSENAQIKAVEYGDNSKVLTLAEDSGLEVAALGGEPGVRSAHWVRGSDEDRYTTLLNKLSNEPNRAARYISVLCLYDPQTKETHFFQGKVSGKIVDQPKGEGGFGYDPVFVPDGETETFAELAESGYKHQHSHRQKALMEFNRWWQNR